MRSRASSPPVPEIPDPKVVTATVCAPRREPRACESSLTDVKGSDAREPSAPGGDPLHPTLYLLREGRERPAGPGGRPLGTLPALTDVAAPNHVAAGGTFTRTFGCAAPGQGGRRRRVMGPAHRGAGRGDSHLADPDLRSPAARGWAWWPAQGVRVWGCLRARVLAFSLCFAVCSCGGRGTWWRRRRGVAWHEAWAPIRAPPHPRGEVTRGLRAPGLGHWPYEPVPAWTRGWESRMEVIEAVLRNAGVQGPEAEARPRFVGCEEGAHGDLAREAPGLEGAGL